MTPESISAELGGAGWVLSDFCAAGAKCQQCSSSQQRRHRERARADSGNRRLLRVTAPKTRSRASTGPRLRRGPRLGRAPRRHRLALSIDDDDEDEEARANLVRRQRRVAAARDGLPRDAALRLQASTDVALALPESCRAARWAAAKRGDRGRGRRPKGGFADDGELFSVEAASAADAVSAAAALPPDSRWAHVKSFTPVSRECVQRLRDAGCGGPPRWSARRRPRGAPQARARASGRRLREWAAESGIR